MSAPKSPSPSDLAPRFDRVIDFGAVRLARRDAQRRAEIAARGFLWINAGWVLPASGAVHANTASTGAVRAARDVLRD
jgi:hypothetical protein